MSKPATHILIEYPSRKTTLLYRAIDGLALACRIETRVLTGEDPNPAKMETRNYLDETFAMMALRRLVDADAEKLGITPSIDLRSGESQILRANGQLVNATRN